MSESRYGRDDVLLVTGGAGFIGSNFVRAALSATRARVVVLDALTYAGSLESLRDLEGEPRFEFVRGDVADRDAVERVMRDRAPSAVVNFAAESHVDRSIDGPSAFVRTTVRGPFELLEAARRLRDGLPAEAAERFRFLHVSTDEVYGSLGREGRFHETTPYAPNSPYSASKAAADHLVRAWGATYGLPVLVTNTSNNYGPYQFPEKLVPLMLLNALEGRPLPLYGDGGNVRDWIFVEDHCQGVLRVLEAGCPGEKYNIGGDCERTNAEIVEMLCAILEELQPAADNPALRAAGMDAYAALVTFVEDRPGHDRRYAIDASKIRGELGFAPRHDLASGLRRTVRWYLDHRDWCESVQRDRYRRERLGLAGAGRAGAAS